MLLTAPLLAVQIPGGGIDPAAGQQPDFSNVDDVLLGRRLVLPLQDVVVSIFGFDENIILQTDQGEVTNEVGYLFEATALSAASGRVFDLENDVVVTMVRTGSEAAALDVRDPLGARSLQVSLAFPICPPTDSCNPNIVALGDLTGDGYDEIVIGYAGGGIQVASAADVTDFTQGLVFGELYQGSNSPPVPVPTPQALAITDLNADGQGEIAAVDLFDFEIYTLVASTDSDDPSLNIERASAVTFDPAGGNTADFELMAGQFDADTSDLELVIGYNGADTGGIQVVLVEVAADLTPTLGAAQSLQNPAQGFAMAVGRFVWFSDIDQLIVADDQGGGSIGLTLYGNDGGNFALAATATVSGTSGCSTSGLADVAVGGFDFDIEAAATSPPTLDVALLLTCRSTGAQVQLFDFQLPDQDFVRTGVQPLAGNPGPGWSAASLIASDTQGRSLLLGPPTKITIDQHSQPRIVLGAPAMHIDYVQDPANSSAAFDKVNMTAFPATDQSSVRGMNSEFDLASSSQTQTQFTHSTSYTYSTGTEVTASIGLNIPDIASMSASMKSTATVTHANMVENKFGTYQSVAFNIQTITGFGDVVWYDTKRFNLWTYRVLGHFICPADDPDCDTTLPLFLTFSGPDQIVPHPHSPGSTVEWYQPYHEVGNILSYPQDLTQLADALSTDVDPVSELAFTTGANDDTETLTWTQGQTQAATSGSVTTHSHSETESVSGSSFLGGTSGTFTESSSASLTTLNTLVQTMAASDGFTVSVPGFNLGAEYSYPFDGYILGDPVDPNVLQTELMTHLQNEVNQTVNGTLRLAFTAQPDDAPGVWWSDGTAPYLSAPDVALNHPFRWSLISESSGPLSSVYCFNVLDRDNVLSGGGYEMKGLLVLAEGATTGPQLTVANDGDTLQLQARVYNYSRLDMSQASPPVTAVKVQFYGQEWDTTTQEFTGDAFLIGEDTLDPIPGNNDNNQGLNAALASVDFATGSCPLEGGCGGKYLKFWVVVWMENAAGNLVADYQDHGLTKLPTEPFTSLGQVPVQPISNNVGFYDQEIYVCPEGADCSTPSDAPPGAGLAIGEVALSKDQASAFETLEASARLDAGAHPVGPVLVFFYEGDPEHGGRLFEVEHVPFIEAHASYRSKVRYQPVASGAHEIFVVAHANHGSATGTSGIEVVEPADTSCSNPLTVASRLSGSIGRIGSGAPGEVQVSAVVSFASEVDLGGATVTIDRLAHELGGAQELVSDAQGESILPLVLDGRGASRSGRVLFETAPGPGPTARLALRRLRGDRLEVSLRVRGLTLPEGPELCSGDPVTTSLMLRLAIDDGVSPAIEVPIEGAWQCLTDRAGEVHRLRARSASLQR